MDTTLRQSSGSIEEESSEEENSDTDASTSSMSDPDDPVNQANRFTADLETTNLLFPQSEGVIDVTQSNMLCHIRRSNDLGKAYSFSEQQKVTVLQYPLKNKFLLMFLIIANFMGIMG